MNKYTIIGLALFIPCISQGILEDPLKLTPAINKLDHVLAKRMQKVPNITYESANRLIDAFRDRAKDASPLVVAWAAVGAVTGVAGYYTYHWVFPSPEERARRAGVGLVDCFKKNIDGPRSRHGIPSACVDKAFAYGLAREALDNREKWPQTQEFIDDFKYYTDSTESS